MKTKKRKLSFAKTTVVDLGKIRGGLKEEGSQTCFTSCFYTECDHDTLCYAVSYCRTVCVGHIC